MTVNRDAERRSGLVLTTVSPPDGPLVVVERGQPPPQVVVDPRGELGLAFFFFQAEDGILDFHVTGVQTCALPISAFRLVGEEYPDFVGDPARAARTQADGERALASGGPVRRALAGRYLAGMSPGYRIGHGLGGNVAGLPRAQVNRWRDAFIAGRARLGVAGFAEFHFVFENSRPVVMRDVTRAVARGMAQL